VVIFSLNVGKSRMPLTPRQWRFVEEYLIDLHAQRAAIRAGYSPLTNATPHKLLRNPEIARAIGEAMAARAKRTGITRERVLEEFARIAFADMRALAEWGPQGNVIVDADALSDDAFAAIALVSQEVGEGEPLIRLERFDKLKALEALARLLDPRRKFDASQAPPPRPDRPH
jgi:phage terminase small subunit